MENTYKRLLTIVLILFIFTSLIGAFPLSVLAENTISITPSAEGAEYDSQTNTLTVHGGGKVSFAPSEGLEFESVEGVKQIDGDTDADPSPIIATLDGNKWVASLPNENAEYIFRGYYSVEVEGGMSTEAVACTVVVNAVTRYTVTFNANGGEIETDSAAIEQQTKFEVINELYAPTRKGHTFLGWSLWPEGPAERPDRMVKNDCELYAIWAEGIVIREKDVVDKIVYISNRDDIADGSISKVDISAVLGTSSLTNEQALELIEGWKTFWHGYLPVEDTYEDYIRSQLTDYTLTDLRIIRNNIERGIWPNDFIADVVIEEIKSREANDLVIAPGYIDSTSDFKVTTGQGLGITYGNEALGDVLASVGTDSNVMVATKFEKAEITRDEARKIVAEWAEIVNTAEGEEQIKNLLTNYSIYELALLQQYTNILILDDSTAQKLYELMMVERDKKKEEAAAKDNEEPLATFSVNTYAVAADGTQTYISVSKSMQYSIPVDPSSIPEKATLALYRINEDGTRTKQEILSVAADCVIAQTDGNSDYILLYEINETVEPEVPDGLSTGAIIAIVAACVLALAGGGFILYWFVFKKKKEGMS